MAVLLTPKERQTLESWLRSTTICHGQARRARIILMLADGVTISRIAKTVGVARGPIYTANGLVLDFLKQPLTLIPRHSRNLLAGMTKPVFREINFFELPKRTISLTRCGLLWLEISKIVLIHGNNVVGISLSGPVKC